MKLLCILALVLSWPAFAAVQVSEEVVALPGVGNLRATISSPRAKGKKPAVLLAGWLSCDTVNSKDPADRFAQFLDRVAERAGVVMMRVDKPGVGGSDGDCADTDFRTELEGYRIAWRQLAARSDVDPARMYVLGLSNGGGIAPLVPSEPAAAGFISIGGWSRTWFEHMIDFERRRLTLKRVPFAEASERMRATARFYDLYLIGRRTPADILREMPELASAWEGDPNRQYGRPPAFFQQLQDLNLAGAWSAVRVPTLIVYGGNDWIMDRDEQELIAAAVNRNGAGLAKLVVLPKMDHFFQLHPSMQASFDSSAPGPFASEAAEIVIRWLRR